jgi:uncharacterized protein (DUF2147 family)
MSKTALQSGLWAAAISSALLLPSVASRAAEPSVAGLWEKADSSGNPEGWFRIAERNGVYEGQIVRMFPKPGEHPSKWLCTKCEGEQKNAPVLGITFIRGMQRNGLAYENGTILDPRDGSVYSARMQLSRDGQQLTVRGYLGISLLGQSQVWRRIAESMLESAKPVGPNAPQRERGRPTNKDGPVR